MSLQELHMHMHMENKYSNNLLIFFLLFINFFMLKMAKSQVLPIPIRVGVVLDMENYVGEMGLNCISMALSDFYAANSHYKTRIQINPRDSREDVVGAAAAALDLLKNVEVEAIIGPRTSAQASFVINLGHKAQVPTIAFSVTSPSLSAIRSRYFVRTCLNDLPQAEAISATIQAFGWREVVLIYMDNEFGEGIIPFLIGALEQVNVRVPYRSVIPPLATDDQIVAELYKLMTMPTRVFVLHMLTGLGSPIFNKAKELGMMSEDYVWIVTDGIMNELSSMEPSVIESMLGVIGIKPYVPKTKELDNFTIRYKKTIQNKNPTALAPDLNIFGLWAYDAAIALAMAVEKARLTTKGFKKQNVSINSTDLEAFGVSINGLKITQALSNTSFIGLSGNFVLVNGQLQSPPYQILNVIGHGTRVIGYWTKENGIVRELNFKNENRKTYRSFGSIIWPGDRTSPPKGWVMPTNGKKLRIGVPERVGFTEFVRVTWNADNSTLVEGYCIDVFDAVMADLPYAAPYEYIAFPIDDPNFVDNLNQGKFDAVAGDIAIVANRAQYVDFTLPYTESGVSMVVPIKDQKSKNAWVFLKPLTWELWLTSFCSFVFIGFLIWILEHRINEDFRGPPGHQVGMIFWFTFSTMVFSNKEKVVSNLARFVLIIWFLVVLILTQSYTASLTSMLTVQQLQPTVTDINELIRNKDYVGYQKGSFVKDLLKRLNFDESRLVVYNSPEQCDELFSKGSGNGGIAAAFDEIPYIKLFLAKYCSKYTMVEPTYKTDGFAFVFPKGSPLVPDVSRAILNITQSEKMVQIEKKWLGDKTICVNSTNLLSSNSLGLESFRGLFMIAGVAAVSALIIHVINFLHEHWHVVADSNPESTILSKITELLHGFDSRDPSSHTFRNIHELKDRNGEGVEKATESHENVQENPSSLTLRLPPINSPASVIFSQGEVFQVREQEIKHDSLNQNEVI